MAPLERANPALLNNRRKMRSAKGSGTSLQEVNKLIKQFDQTRKLMKMMTDKRFSSVMKNMKGNLPDNMPR